MQKFKLTRVTAIVIGVVIALAVIGGGLMTYLNVFSRASNSAPSDVIITKITSQSATISWSTGEETQGTIEYGTSPAEMGFYAPEATAGTMHKVDLSLLQPNTLHYFIIRVDDNVYDNGGIPWTFTTKEVEGEPTATPSGTIEDPPATPSASVTPSDEDPTPTDEDPEPTSRNGSPTPRTSRAPTARASTPTKTPVPTRVSCTSTNCDAIASYLGPGKCSVQDYYKCLYKKITPSATPSISITPSASPSPSILTPSNLTTTANSATQVTLNWSDTSNNESGFEIQRAIFSSNPAFDAIATKSAGIVTHVDSAATTGTSYVYRVRAFIVGGSYSGFSNTSQVTTP